MKRQPRTAAALALLLLAGCSTPDLSDLNPFGSKEPPLPCPRVHILADAASLTRFQPGPGQDLTDVVFEAGFHDVGMACKHDIDKYTGDGKLEVDIQVIIEASRGPADTARQATASYFVSITGEGREVLQKGAFDVNAAFPGNFTKVNVTDDPIYLTIPLRGGRYGRDFDIWIGFQLTPEELEYNRRRRQLTR